MGVENFFAQESKLDLGNVCSEDNSISNAEAAEGNGYVHNMAEDEPEDPALIEKVGDHQNIVILGLPNESN